MPKKVNEGDLSMIELRRRNLLAAELLEGWVDEADSEDDCTDWSVLEKELQI
jgi:hypothetical protein